MKCKHDWVKITNFDKNNGACLLLLTWDYRTTKTEKYICLKCGSVIR